eukprot:14733863-Alexandrium_andersonii.AAC.1
MDLGLSQEILGNIFWEAVEGLVEGKNRALRVKAFWALVKAHYKVARPPTQLQGLTEEVIKRVGKAPRLKAK